MRHIPLPGLARELFAESEGGKVKARLFRGHLKLARMSADKRQSYLKKNGRAKWTPVKSWLTARLGNKCWYTEAELVGAQLAIDHYRPASTYWWLAFDVENYRVACPFANSPEHNKTHGCAGGKGGAFPLLGPGSRASGRNRQRFERPVILDPCAQRDCDLLAFQADGRPVLNPTFSSDPVARQRVEESKILLNLDHPDFNAKREQLCNEIADDVKLVEALDPGSAERAIPIARLERRLGPSAPFSSAARYYVSLHREHEWVDELLARV